MMEEAHMFGASNHILFSKRENGPRLVPPDESFGRGFRVGGISLYDDGF